jgi:hypothetical protein
MRYKNHRSLEDAIRSVQQKYKNVPSPLKQINENIGYTPTQIPNQMRASSKDLRGNLLGNFRPSLDTYR